MSRILRHISSKDLKRTHQKKLSEQKELAAKKLKECQEAEEEKKQIEEVAKPYKSNWREEIQIQESEWFPIPGSGPTNSASQSFQYGGEGGPIATFSGLGGVEAYPSTVNVDGETLNAPDYSQLGLQGYAPKLNPKYAEAQKKYEKEYAEWEKQRDENSQKIKDTLKSFGTSFEELRASKKWVKKLGDGTFVSIMPTGSNPGPMDWTDNVRIVKLKQAANADPMYIDYNTKEIDPLTGKKYPWMAHNVEIQNDVYLEVGERPKPPMEQEYLIPRRTDFKDVNPQLDASQEFAQKVGADEFMNARVQSGEFTPEQKAAIDAWNAELIATMDRHQREWAAVLKKDEVYNPEKHKGLQARQDAEIEAVWNKEPKFDTSQKVEPLAPSILPMQDAVLATLQYAFGLYDPKKKRKGGQTKELEKAMLNTIGNSIRRGDTSGRVVATLDYHGQEENIPAQGYLHNYGYSVDYDKGIIVDDRFNFDDVLGTRIGGAFVKQLGPFQPLAQAAATGLVGLGDRVSKNIMGIDPRDDARAGFPVQYTIPWSRVPANHPAWKLRKKKKEEEEEVVESTWSKINKYR